MKIQRLYICEQCGTEYANKCAAKECEMNHKVPVTVEAFRYLPRAADESGLPLVVQVTMAGGKKVRYKKMGY